MTEISEYAMSNQNIKYSIIIPARNGAQYLSYCVKTIISQDYTDYELIISDDHSTDGTDAYLSTLVHPRVKIIHPPEELSMTEHWEWALARARGEWLMFVGQDDGLQPYFFRLADRLTGIAQKADLRTIMSERAYFFWPGCESVYGDIAVGYHARNSVKIHNCLYGATKALFGLQSYFNLPEMYTTSLFHRDIISEAKQKQHGRLLSTHPQDANLAAIACSLENRYLMSYIPLGWVGSSLRSAGLAISFNGPDPDAPGQNNAVESLKKEYVGKINRSELEYNYLAGDFLFEDASIYLWQSFLQTQDLRSPFVNKILNSKLFKSILFCRVLNNVGSSGNSTVRLPMFKEILERNQCIFGLIELFSKISFLAAGIFLMAGRVLRKASRLLSNCLNYTVARSHDPSMDIVRASERVNELITKKEWII